jgi:hypothetical protein
VETGLDFMVRRDDPTQTRFAPAALSPLAERDVVLAVDRFAFTANNITYATFGERMSYWNFFPAPVGFGRIPVWGYGTVVRSQDSNVREGERFYGYYPMSTHLIVEPARASAAGFSDGVAHRADLHPLYNQYTRTSTDPLYDAAREAQTMLLRPLFVTSFVIDDLLGDNAFFGADAVLLSSASSKTAWGIAFLLAERKRRGETVPQIVGLTSQRNVAYVEHLGFYDRVVTYAEVTDLPREWRVAYIDFAGDRALLTAVHEHFGDGVRFSSSVGYAHNAPRASGPKTGALPGAAPAVFFAPDQIRKRNADWGPGGFASRFAAAWHAVVEPASDPARGWLRVEEAHGKDAVERVYRDALAGRLQPDTGNILAL